MEDFVGRQREIGDFTRCLAEDRSHFVAVYGRRRVGKTYLIRHFFKNQFSFYATGLANANMKTQLTAFHTQLIQFSGSDNDESIPSNWLEAFSRLIVVLERSRKKKKVVFLDELPWMDTRRSGFITALEYFWNSWASARNDILLVVCGSAASWMINKLLKAKGGLHNRVTQQIKVEPFSLYEVELFLKNRKYKIDRYQIIQLYMSFGGIPYYLEKINTSLSVPQNIEALCFTRQSSMSDEYDILFHSLFDSPQKHMSIVNALAISRQGLTRAAIIKKTKLPNAGSTTRTIKELELSNFIRGYRHYGKKSRETTYQLIDNFALFYHRFIKGSLESSNNWINNINTPEYYGWAGSAFEIVVLQHIDQVKIKLGIAGVYAEVSSFQNRNAQIDLVIDRKDRVINLVEAKFSINPYEITKSYDATLRTKLDEFIKHTKTRKAVWLTMVTTFGLKNNAYSGNVQHTLTMDDLFEPSV